MRVLLILPAYNEEGNICNTVRQILRFKEEANPVFQVDYLVINDGSTDKTEAVCRGAGIHCLTLTHNLGIGGAVQTGYCYAVEMGYDIAVQFDGDGQHDISSLPDLLAPILEGEAEFVVGSRFLTGSSDFHSTNLRRVGIRYLSWLVKRLTGARITDVTSGYRAANKRAMRFLAQSYPRDYPEPEALVTLYKNHFRVSEVQVNMFERASGKSSITLMKSIYYMIKVTLAILFAGSCKGGKRS